MPSIKTVTHNCVSLILHIVEITNLFQDLIAQGFETMVYVLRIPAILKRVLGKLLIPLYPRIGQFLCSSSLNTSELRQTYENIEAYRELYIKRMQELRLDALICPVQVKLITDFYQMHLDLLMN